jgi:hypothetical protein
MLGHTEERRKVMRVSRWLGGISMAALLAATTIGAAGPAIARGEGPSIGRAAPANFNISKAPGNQSEDAVVFNQTNPLQLTVVSNEESISGLFHGWSTDGGKTWSTDVIADNDNLGTACCDPSLASDNYGNIFLTWLTANISVSVAMSTNGGASFTKIATFPVGAPGPGQIGRANKGATPRLGSGDQPSIVAAENQVWVTFTANTIVAQGASVTGLGQVGAFSSPEAPSSGHRTGDYGDVAIGPNGQVVISYQDPTGGEGPATVYEAVDPDGIGPSPMGAGTTVLVSNVGGFDYIPAQAGRSVDIEIKLEYDRTGGAHNGRLYLLWTQETPNESNNTDIMVQYSDNDGGSWSTAIKVNDDAGTNSQFNPRMSLDPTTGNIAVAWYDCRNDLGNHGQGDTNGRVNDDAMVYGTSSKDGGVTFAANTRISRGVSNSADAQNGIDYGDYEGMAFYGGVYFYVWADNSNSTGDNPDGTLKSLDIYTARVRVR